MRQRGVSPNTPTEDSAKEHWAFLVFLVFLLALAGVTVWLSFSGQGDVVSAQRERASDLSSDVIALGFNEPIQPIIVPTDLNPKKVELGFHIFSDVRVSGDNSVACISCHDLSRGGADHRAFSIGAGGVVGKINTLTVYNAANNIMWFWNGSATSLEDQLDGPVLSPNEMNSDWDAVVTKFKHDTYYVSAFNEIYSDGVTVENIKNAIVEFERSLVTPNSPFDRYLRGDFYAIDEEAKQGYALFKEYGCSSCHQGVNVGGNLLQVFGVVGNYFEDRGNIKEVDYGRFNVTGQEVDRYRFRVPSLRNVALTAPYFHDGSAETLQDAVYVMAKYQLGRKIPQKDVDLIIRFLHTLTGEMLYGENR